MRTLLAVLSLVALCLGVSSRAEARTVRDEPYPLDTTWNAAVRMVRVDFGFTIEERDRDLGYFTFQYREGRRTMPGSVEVLRADVDGRTGTRIIVQIPQMPGYIEAMLLAHLGRKLRSEFGEPPPPPPRRAPAPSPPPEPPAAGERPAEGQPPPTPAPAQPGTTPTTVTRWEGPRRIRLIDDWE
jgi:hypothetical protein